MNCNGIDGVQKSAWEFASRSCKNWCFEKCLMNTWGIKIV